VREKTKLNNFLLTAANFVAVIATIVVMIAFEFRVDAFLTIGASKLVERANHTLGSEGTQLFVAFVATVIIAVTLLLYRYAQWILFLFFAWEIAILHTARSVR